MKIRTEHEDKIKIFKSITNRINIHESEAKEELADEFYEIARNYSMQDILELLTINCKALLQRADFIKEIANFKSTSGKHGIDFIKNIFEKLKKYKNSELIFDVYYSDVYREIETAIEEFERKSIKEKVESNIAHETEKAIQEYEKAKKPKASKQESETESEA